MSTNKHRIQTLTNIMLALASLILLSITSLHVSANEPINVRIEAEDYHAYYDSSSGNNGNQYREDDVDIQLTSDEAGNYNVGWTSASEWLEYNVTLAAGSYQLTTRVAATNSGGAYTVSLNGNQVASDTVAATGGWQNWQTQQLNEIVVSSTGTYSLRVDISAGGFNLNYIDLIAETVATPSIIKIEAEDYHAFSDSSSGNNGGQYRSDDVDIQATSDSGGGYNIGWTDAGEWLEYNVNLTAGIYQLTSRIASPNSSGAYNISLNGTPTLSDTVSSTGGWQAWQSHDLGEFSTAISGEQTLRVNITSGGFNLNYLELTKSSTNTPTPSTITPLFSNETELEQAIQFDRGDALVTRFADRGRDRHAKEDQFQAYDHYLSHYWTHRTARIQFEDYVAKGGNRIDITFITEWKLGAKEFRAWYYGMNTVAEYHGNYGGNVVEQNSGTFDNNFNKISDNGDQYLYTLTINEYRSLNGAYANLAIGQRMEVEISQFLDSVPEGRENYYGTTYLYIIGQGFVPWYTQGDFLDKSSDREDSFPIPQSAWLGGKTTLPYGYTNEPDNHFMQMATNLSHINGQAFVLGRRIHHTDFVNGAHDESADNGIFAEMAGKAGNHYVNSSCANCHTRNGRAAPAQLGEPLNKWVFKVGQANGDGDANLGKVLQPSNVNINDAVHGEGEVSIDSWTETAHPHSREFGTLRSPNYKFSRHTPELFSARIAPQLVGLGLLEAIDENTILAREDINDDNNDDISGKAQRVIDPITGETRLGRFGWKAATSSLTHQIAAALNTDMGVMTSVLPTPDCGANQTTCGNSGSELSDQHLKDLVKYVALLGVRPQRNIDNTQVQQGKILFNEIGCNSCHVDTLTTSDYHPYAELRSQTIHPYSDLLLHDMGPGLADNLGEGAATGSEWRTTPLWGLGLSACVTGGVINPEGGQGNEICAPVRSYLHDGRARTIEEAILWHGGEGQNSQQAYQTLTDSEKSTLLTFLNSL